MFNIVLFEPEIPPNTGNAIRLSANTGCQLHLIEPLGFELDDKKLRRAGLDYSEFANVKSYPSWDSFKEIAFQAHPDSGLFGLTTKATQSYHELNFTIGDYFVFGPETRGLPDYVLNDLRVNSLLRIPMKKESRSLNLSNSVTLVVYEALRQHEFASLV